MYWYSPQELEFSPEHRRLLQEVEIGYESGPGTILHDIEVLLAYIEERELELTAAHQLPLRVLPTINARLAHPIEHALKRPQQKSFPHIHGLFLLVRASGLTYVDWSGNKPFLLLDGGVNRSWQSLNPTERYGNLLETWLVRGNPAIVGERERRYFSVPEYFHTWLSLLAPIPDEGLQIAGDKDTEGRLPYILSWLDLGLLDLFGLVDVRRGAPQAGKGWQIDHIALSRFGQALMTLFHSKFFNDFEYILELEEEEEIPYGVLQPTLRPYFPEWKNNLSLPKLKSREGVHIFKVSLGRMWRRIAVPADRTLDTLATTILDAVGFDYDHLYQFSYQNRYGARAEANHPYIDLGPWTSDLLVSDVPPHIGQRMTFVYDFGDYWEFDVTLEQVDPDSAINRSMVLEEHGEPPQQYPTWDECE